jgi:hypothetical protein
MHLPRAAIVAVALGCVVPLVFFVVTQTDIASVKGRVASGAKAPTKKAPEVENPFLSKAFDSFIKGRTDSVTAAVYDVESGKTYLYRPGVRQVTASMVKIDILADLLYQAQQQHRSLTASESEIATSMIEESSDDSATSLWNEDGQLPGISAFDNLVGFKQTIMSWSWGEIETTPLDELSLLKVITLPNSILTNASRAYEERLMQNVDVDQRFGLGSGPPATATIGIKDGWYPEVTTGWQINSAGYVHDGTSFYLAVIMSADNSSELYGESTLNSIATLIWQNLTP